MFPFRYFLLLFALLALVTTSIAPARAGDDTTSALHREHEAFAKDFAQVVLAILHDPKKSYGDRKNILRRSFANSVDIDWIARFALGKSWKDANDQQRERYTELYRKYLTEAYVTNFAENPRKSIYDIKIFSVSDEGSDNFTVHTQMQLMNQVNLKVDYLVNEKDGSYKVRDFVIENVSLIATHRAEFTALASTHGIDGVIRKLEQLVDEKGEMTVSMK